MPLVSALFFAFLPAYFGYTISGKNRFVQIVRCCYLSSMGIYCRTCFSIGDLGVQVSVRPSICLSVNIYPGCLVSATPPTVLYRSFWNFVYIFCMVWRCACGLNIIVRLFFVTPICELSHFFTSIYRQWVPLVSATPLIVLYWLFCNFACVFFHGMRTCMWFGYIC